MFTRRGLLGVFGLVSASMLPAAAQAVLPPVELPQNAEPLRPMLIRRRRRRHRPRHHRRYRF